MCNRLKQIDSGFSYRLDFLRKEKKMSYSDLAYSLKVSPETIREWCNGLSYPYQEIQIDLLCCKFKVNKHWLMRGYI